MSANDSSRSAFSDVFRSIFPRYPSQSKRRKKRKALKEEQALSEAQLHREGTHRKLPEAI